MRPRRYHAHFGISLLIGVLLSWCCRWNVYAIPPTPPAPPEAGANALPNALVGAAFYTETIIIPTYPYTAHLTTALNPTYNITYPVLNWNTYAPTAPVSRPYTLLVLENAYLKITVMPELGGRVYQFIDKATGQNQLYQNPVIKPTRWGPPEQGWWLAVGGIEWCLPVEEHGYEWGIPWRWEAITSTAGVTLTMRDSDAPDRLRARVRLFLPTDRAYLEITPRLENPTAAPITYKYWSNAALALGAGNRPNAQTEFLFHAPEMTVHSADDNRLPDAGRRFAWPIYAGVDFSRLSNWQGWLGFFEYPQAVADFVGLYDHTAQAGMVRVFPHTIARGVKGFAAGWTQALPPSLWTDDDSAGIEIHGGVAPTFADAATLEAGATISWSEVWYPLRATPRVVQATRDAALSAHILSHTLHVQVNPTQARPAGDHLRIWDHATCAPLADWTLGAATPFTPLQSLLPVGERSLEQIAAAYVDAQGQVLAEWGAADCLSAQPAPHVRYGLNLRLPNRSLPLANATGFEWIKLWEEYSGLPTQRLPQQVLYLLDCRGYINDMAAWRAHVLTVAQAGVGKVEAYEICNEPNVKSFWNGQAPNPAHFTEMLCAAYETIHTLSPRALVVSGGLAPVGRIAGVTNGWQGHNGDAMDERTYTQAMLAAGAARCMDAFGYHPYGFAAAPERPADLVSNGFAFRGVEPIHALLQQNDAGDIPIWATEFNWLRDPAEDGRSCSSDATFQQYFDWMKVSAQTQGDYLARAYAYADRHWPWLEGLFTWNLDWQDYKPEHPCEASRYYAVRRDDGTPTGASAPAYTALQTLPKRPALSLLLARLEVRPPQQTVLLGADALRPITVAYAISNTAGGAFTWTATVAPGSQFTPTLPVTRGAPGDPLWITLDPRALPVAAYPGTLTFLWAGDFTAAIAISATPAPVFDAPQTVTLTLRVAPHLYTLNLPLVARNYSTAQGPHGPSKLGTHALADGGTVELATNVHAGGGHVAVVKAVSSFGYLQQVKQVSPETITIGRWSHYRWEAMPTLADPDFDPVARAQEYMAAHITKWTPYRAYVDYWEVLNEPDTSVEGHVNLARFYIAAMDIAEANGYHLALFSYSMGVPEWYEWQAIMETGVFARAQRGGHILALHEYGGPLLRDRWGEPMPHYPGQPLEEQPRYPDRGVLGGRYRHLYRDFLIPRNEVIPLVITECNLAIDEPNERDPYFLEDIFWYDDRLREDDYVLGMNIFTLGNSGWEEFNFYHFLPAIQERILMLKDTP